MVDFWLVTDLKIISELLSLPPKQRAKIAGILLRSLDDEENVDERKVENAWTKEIERRVEQIRRGKVKLIPGDLFTKKLRTKVRQARRAAK